MILFSHGQSRSCLVTRLAVTSDLRHHKSRLQKAVQKNAIWLESKRTSIGHMKRVNHTRGKVGLKQVVKTFSNGEQEEYWNMGVK